MHLPNRTQVLVIGGGPAGATGAAFLAREGVEVTLVDKEVFPAITSANRCCRPASKSSR